MITVVVSCVQQHIVRYRTVIAAATHGLDALYGINLTMVRFEHALPYMYRYATSICLYDDDRYWFSQKQQGRYVYKCYI